MNNIVRTLRLHWFAGCRKGVPKKDVVISKIYDFAFTFCFKIAVNKKRISAIETQASQPSAANRKLLCLPLWRFFASVLCVTLAGILTTYQNDDCINNCHLAGLAGFLYFLQTSWRRWRNDSDRKSFAILKHYELIPKKYTKTVTVESFAHCTPPSLHTPETPSVSCDLTWHFMIGCCGQVLDVSFCTTKPQPYFWCLLTFYKSHSNLQKVRVYIFWPRDPGEQHSVHLLHNI